MSLNLITLSRNTLILNASACCLKFAFCDSLPPRQHTRVRFVKSASERAAPASPAVVSKPDSFCIENGLPPLQLVHKTKIFNTLNAGM